MAKPLSYFLEPPPLPPEDLEPMPDKQLPGVEVGFHNVLTRKGVKKALLAENSFLLHLQNEI